jgi:hypothetical protein
VARDVLPAPGAAPEPPGKELADDGRQSESDDSKQFAARKSAVADEVVELPVTYAQADRALAFYSQALERQEQQSARRYTTAENLAGGTVHEAFDETADRYSSAAAERETSLERTATGMSLIKLLDATTQGVQVASLEVTGTETEVQALLDSLGVDEARDLHKKRSARSGSAGGAVMLRNAIKGEEGASPGEAATRSAASAPANRAFKADAATDKVAEAKGGSPPAFRAARENAPPSPGGLPTVKMESAFGGGGALAGARDAQAKGLDGAEPQIRVRLIIMPAADPMGPATEVLPADEATKN